MYVSAYIHPKWFVSENDRDLHFLKQIGVDHVDISLNLIQGYEATGTFEKSGLARLVDRLDRAGLKIERVTARGKALIEDPGDVIDVNEEIDKLCRVTEMVGEAGIPVMLPYSPSLEKTHRQGAAMGTGFFQGQYAGQLIDPAMSGWEEREGRGGYGFPAYRHEVLEETEAGVEEDETAEQLWEELVKTYRILMPVAESAGVLMAQHGADPPISPLRGKLQILVSHAEFDRLFQEVPSPNNGMTFCVGTRYESGEDIFEGIKRFGSQGKIFHVHFRNVRGTLPEDGGYEERFTDDGDINMMDVVRALKNAGYNRALDYDHVVRTFGDSFIGRQSAAFSAGYIRGLLAEV
jgi:D-mannonate dehydratase